MMTLVLAGITLPSSAAATTLPETSSSSQNAQVARIIPIDVQSLTAGNDTPTLIGSVDDFVVTPKGEWQSWHTKQVHTAEEAATRLAAEKAAAKKAAALEKAAAVAGAAANVPIGAKQTYAFTYMAANYGWTDTDQQTCLLNLWNRESGWSTTANNTASGAYGIPQSLPGTKMASVGSDWKTNYKTQIKWGLQYINGSYGSPCSAWAHSNSSNWY